MEQNVGGIDRTARLIGGPIVALLGILILIGTIPGSVLLGGVLVVVGAILLGTGLTQRCLVHRLLGINTTKRP